jgi:hypothetical protein
VDGFPRVFRELGDDSGKIKGAARGATDSASGFAPTGVYLKEGFTPSVIFAVSGSLETIL